MSRLKKRSPKIGLPPGTLVHIGERKAETTHCTTVRYNETILEEKRNHLPEDLFASRKAEETVWINVDGLHDMDAIRSIGVLCGLHPLTLEDIVNTEQRPKVEIYDRYLFIVLKMIEFSGEKGEIRVDQLSLVLQEGLLLSFQEGEGALFAPLRERMQNQASRIRKEGVDYLAYGLMDAVVDHYFLCLERLGERIEDLQEALVSQPNNTTMHEIHRLKRELIFLRRAVWPLREVINVLLRGESSPFTSATLVYLRDVYDHVIQVIDTLEIYREMLSGMVDIYLSSMSNRMNEVMKILTIIATIFIPLTFIAGVYGMNFRFMPELECPYGYPAVLLLMLAVAVVMLIFFRKRRWL